MRVGIAAGMMSIVVKQLLLQTGGSYWGAVFGSTMFGVAIVILNWEKV